MRGDLDPLGDAIKKAQDMLEDFAGRAQGIFRTVTGVEGWDDLFAKIRRGIAMFEDSDEGVNRLAVALKYTEERAGLTIIQLSMMSDEITKISKYTNDAVDAAQLALLDFKYVRGVEGVFQDTLKAATDLAAVTGGSLTEATRTLGEILNDPVEGMFKLKELHISLSKEQKAQIVAFMRWGDIVAAQKVILKAFNDEIGGQGERAANTFGARMDKLAEASDAVWRSVGQFVVPYLNRAIDIMNKVSLVAKTLAADFYDSFGPSGLEGSVDSVFETLTRWFWKFVDVGTSAFSYVQAAIQEWDDFSGLAFSRFKQYAIGAFMTSLTYAATWAQATVEFMKPAIDYMADVWDYAVVLAKFAWEAMAALATPWLYKVQAVFNAAFDFSVGIWQGMVEIAQWAWTNMAEPAIDFSFKVIGAIYVTYLVAKQVWWLIVAEAKLAWAVLSAGWEAVGLLIYAAFVATVEPVKLVFKGIASLFEAVYNSAKTSTNIFVQFFAAEFVVLMDIVKIWVKSWQVLMEAVIGPLKYVFDGLRAIGVAVVDDFIDAIKNKFKPAFDKVAELKAKLKGVEAPGMDFGKMREDLDKAMKGIPGFEPGKNDINVNIKDNPALKKALDDLKKSQDAMDKAAAGGGQFDKKLQDNLDANRKRVQDFYDKALGIVDSDKYKKITGGDPFSKFPEAGQGAPVGGSQGKMEDLFALNRRIQEAAARPPELKELELQTQIMKEELLVQQAVRDHLIGIHRKNRPGVTTPKFAMQDLVTPEGMGP